MDLDLDNGHNGNVHRPPLQTALALAWMTSHPYYHTILLALLPPASRFPPASQFRQFKPLLQVHPWIPIGSPKASFQPFFLFATTRSHSLSQIAPLAWLSGYSARLSAHLQ